MSKAAQRALEAYPRDDDKELNFRRANYRIAYERGYEQALKDIRSEKTEDALLMETGIAARLSVLRGLAIKKGNDELAEKIVDEIDYIYGLYSSADGGINPDASGVCWTVKRSPIFTEKKEEIE